MNHLYYSLGKKAYRFESWLERNIIQNNAVMGDTLNEREMNPRTQIRVEKIERQKVIDKGIDWLVDITVFKAGFIALSLFWLHERTRDYNAFVKHMGDLEVSNQGLKVDYEAIM